MVKLIKLKLCFLLAGICFSCNSQVPKRVKKNFTYCYDSTTDYSTAKLKLNGYYTKTTSFQRPNSYDKGDITEAILYDNMMFFADGIFVSGFQQLICNSCADLDDKIQYLKNLENNKDGRVSLFYNGFVWGVYKIEGNIVKTQSTNRQSWPNPYWYLFEQWYLIKENGTLELVYTKNLIDGRYSLEKQNTYDTYDFIEANLNLTSDTWLKNEKWIWCDEEQYKKWKEKQK